MRRIGKALKWIVILLILAAVGLAIPVGIKTANFKSRQIDVVPAEVIEVDEQVVADRLAKALAIQTISHQTAAQIDGDAFRAMHAYLEESFPKTHQQLKREVVADYSLLYKWEGTDPARKPILLMSHLDVVPVEPGTEGNWEHPPFGGEIAEGYVWGRGAIDNKSGVLAIMEAIEHLVGAGFQPATTIYLAFGHDEEIGGTGNIAISVLLRGRGVQLEYVLDEGSAVLEGIVAAVEKPVASINLAEKGYATVELTTKQDGGHSSMPPAQSAVGVISDAVRKLEQNPFPATLREPGSVMFDYLGPEMPFAQKTLMANRWLTAPLLTRILAGTPSTNAMLRTTTAVTMISGGIKENVLPTSARAVVNFRLLPGDSVQDVVNHVRRAINDPRVEATCIEQMSSEASRVSSVDSRAFETIHRTVREVFPETVVAPGLTLGATDSRHYEGIADDVYRFIPMRMRPDDLKRFHGTNERIGVANHAEMIRFYVQLIKNSAQ